MRFFLDENFPKAARGLLDRMGHQCLDIRGTEQEGAHDNDLFAMVQDADVVLLTTDKDFFHTVPHIYSQHCAKRGHRALSVIQFAKISVVPLSVSVGGTFLELEGPSAGR